MPSLGDMDTVPVPVLGGMILPKESAPDVVMASGLETVADTDPVVEAETAVRAVIWNEALATPVD